MDYIGKKQLTRVDQPLQPHQKTKCIGRKAQPPKNGM